MLELEWVFEQLKASNRAIFGFQDCRAESGGARWMDKPVRDS